MRLSRTQTIGSLLIIAVIWLVILYRVIFSGS